eukprot:GILJ01002854.1.p1 GENE.GILJ01002854.1~~GILJ01002854.1.p1  ORF type:complete len:308 (-),score=59.62 GILJ01002854.1:163-1086(-)
MFRLFSGAAGVGSVCAATWFSHRQYVAKQQEQDDSSSDAEVDKFRSNPNFQVSEKVVNGEHQIIVMHKKDAIAFSSLQNNRELRDHAIKGYNGLSSKNDVDRFLKEENYIELLKHIWSEKDPKVRNEWLQRQVNSSNAHPLLMLEYATEQLRQNPLSHENINENKAWSVAGLVRAANDAACVDDMDAENSVQKLEGIYEQASESALSEENKKMIKEYKTYMTENFDKGAHLKYHDRVKSVGRQVLREAIQNADSLPSPVWLAYNTLGCYMNGGNVTMFPKEEWKTRREEHAKLLEQAFFSQFGSPSN